MATKTIPLGVTNFDDLPPAALIDARAFAVLLGCSVNTIWRRSAAGTIPKPFRVSPQQTRWRVGDVRKTLASLTNQEKPAL